MIMTFICCGLEKVIDYDLGTFIECKLCGKIYYDMIDEKTKEVTMKELPEDYDIDKPVHLL